MSDVPARAAFAATNDLAFLELGERLRLRGQYAAAAAVARAGLAHYPALADAHDLLARINADKGDDRGAAAAWHAALECDPHHIGARKGLAFIAFRHHDLGAAERHLETAVIRAPHDSALRVALDRVRRATVQEPADSTPRLDDPAGGVLLFDRDGMRLAGHLEGSSGDAVADATAATAVGVAHESDRVARLLLLGALRHVVIESVDHRIAILAVGDRAGLLVRRTTATPIGRLLALAQRASGAARDWLDRVA